MMRYCGMRGRKIKEKGRSAIERYIRNIADINQKSNDIRIADITELSEMQRRKRYAIKEHNYKLPGNSASTVCLA
jgi:hypothetical protein